MKNWKAIAQAQQLGIPEEDLTRAAAALDRLEAVFRPLVRDLPHSVEPAVIFSPIPEEAK
jgi:hypothetical protein